MAMTIRTRRRVRATVMYAIAVLSTIVMLAPLSWVASTSVRPLEEVIISPPRLIPRTITFQPYVDMWTAAPFLQYTINSTVVSVVAATAALASAVLAAFAFVRFRFTGRKSLLAFVVMAQMLPGAAILLPLFQIIRWLGLFDTQLGLILVYTGFTVPFCTWLLTGYFKAIPRELEECALVDGATRVGAMLRIVFPVAIPGILSAGIFAFTLSWNEFLYALVFLSSPENKTVAVGVASELIRGDVYFWGELMAGALLGSLPVALVYSLFVEHYVTALSGSMKG